jgi:hypothetical protein
MKEIRRDPRISQQELTNRPGRYRTSLSEAERGSRSVLLGRVPKAIHSGAPPSDGPPGSAIPMARPIERCPPRFWRLDPRPLIVYKPHMPPVPHLALNPCAFPCRNSMAQFHGATHVRTHALRRPTVQRLLDHCSPHPAHRRSEIVTPRQHSCDVRGTVQQRRCYVKQRKAMSPKVLSEFRFWPHLQRKAKKHPAGIPAKKAEMLCKAMCPGIESYAQEPTSPVSSGTLALQSTGDFRYMLLGQADDEPDLARDLK